MQIIFGAVELDLKEINIQTLYIADIITAFGLEPGVYTHMQNKNEKNYIKNGEKASFYVINSKILFAGKKKI